MKTSSKKNFITISSFLISHFIVFFCSPAWGNVSEIYLESPLSSLNLEEKTYIDVRAKSMSPVYGMELSLTFNPKIIEILDADENTEGIQTAPGSFFDLTQKYFPLQNHADLTAGKIKYAVSMLNPTPSAQGGGLLLRIPFRGKSEGNASFQVEKIKFGTRDGKVIIPEIGKIDKIKVVSNSYRYLLILIPALLLCLFAVIWLKRLNKEKK